MESIMHVNGQSMKYNLKLHSKNRIEFRKVWHAITAYKRRRQQERERERESDSMCSACVRRVKYADSRYGN